MTSRFSLCPTCGRDNMRMQSIDECHACRQWRRKHGGARPADKLPPTLADRPEGHLTTPEVAKAVGLTKRQVDYWVRTGRISPSGPGELGGSGVVRWWTPDDLNRMRRVAERIRWGLTVDAAFRDVDPPLPRPIGANA